MSLLHICFLISLAFCCIFFFFVWFKSNVCIEIVSYFYPTPINLDCYAHNNFEKKTKKRWSGIDDFLISCWILLVFQNCIMNLRFLCNSNYT